MVTHDLDDPLPDGDVFGVLVQYPGASGRVRELAPIVTAAHDRGALVTVAADLLGLALLVPPGEVGADIAVGTSQRFGVPLGFGGPHAGYMAIRSGLERQLPGRLVGVSIDADGQPAYRLALQTREQHIRRERATSNICTAQVLLAVIAGMYAVYHGADGIQRIAQRAHRMAAILAAGLRENGIEVSSAPFFDTLTARVPGGAADVVAAALVEGINLRLVDADTVGIACDETTHRNNLVAVWRAFRLTIGYHDIDRLDESTPDALPVGRRISPYLTHPVFSAHRSETEMLRYLRRLADKDYALDRGMIPLGSCTMKLNATTELEPITLPGFADVHPFAPEGQYDGYRHIINDLEHWLAEITGYDAVSLQPNAGSQGEFAGLLAIRGYHRARGQEHRDVCLIPASAHGTNAASAVMAGMRVVVVKTAGEAGEIDFDDLRAKIATHADALAAVMVTYPSTHGVFEENITELCALVHEAGGQVYVDGANLNAMVGLARPGQFGADVSHLNLHKTFCIPHGGGGPGVGPIGVRAHLAPYLPNHPLRADAGPASGAGAIAAAPWGSASILPITWAYLRLMGPDRPDPSYRCRDPVGQLPRETAGGRLSGALHRSAGPGGARVHPRSAADHPGHGHHCRRRGQAAHRLRIPRADHVLPGCGHVDGRADRVGEPRGAEPICGGDGRYQGRDREGRVRRLAPGGESARQRPAHGVVPDGEVGPSVHIGRGGLP